MEEVKDGGRRGIKEWILFSFILTESSLSFTIATAFFFSVVWFVVYTAQAGFDVASASHGYVVDYSTGVVEHLFDLDAFLVFTDLIRLSSVGFFGN